METHSILNALRESRISVGILIVSLLIGFDMLVSAGYLIAQRRRNGNSGK